MVFTSYVEIQQIHISINTLIDEYKHIHSQVGNYEYIYFIGFWLGVTKDI